MPSSQEQLCGIFRWHVDNNPGGKFAEVTITPADGDALPSLESVLASTPYAEPCEDLDWWVLDPGEMLEGYIPVSVLQHAVMHTNARRLELSGSQREQTAGRVVPSDAVLVQYLNISERRRYNREFSLLHEILRRKRYWQDVSPLAETPSRAWLDLTLAARRNARNLYVTLLDKHAEENSARDAQQPPPEGPFHQRRTR